MAAGTAARNTVVRLVWRQALLAACVVAAGLYRAPLVDAAEKPAAATASGPAPSAATAIAPGKPSDEVAEFVFVERTQPDRIGRVMAPVFVNGQGPYRFIVDTGASRSVIAPHVAAALGLVPDDHRQVQLRGITGSAIVPTISVDRLQAGDLKVEHQRLPVVAPSVFADADGILGVDGFQGLCLMASFAAQRISITRKGCPLEAKDWPRARAALRLGGLASVPARVGNRKVQLIIDTGAERSLGNPALLKALALEKQVDPLLAAQILGATPDRAVGRVVLVPKITLGEFEVTDLLVTFSDLEVFRIWGLAGKPAIVLGMDAIGSADGLVVDYRRNEVRLQPRESSDKLRLKQSDFGRLP